MYFQNYSLSKTWLEKYKKSIAAEYPWRSNMVNGPKHGWNLNGGTVITFIDHCEGNWLWKSLSQWYAKSSDWLLSPSLPMTSILFLIENIQRKLFICNYLYKQKAFSLCFSAVLKPILNFKHFQKKDDTES